MITLTKCLCSPTVGTIMIVTTCAENETPEECRARHLRTVAAWKAAIPDAIDCDCPN